MSVTPDGAVFLQLSTNKYLAISASELNDVYEAIESNDHPAIPTDRLIQDLTDAGVLTVNRDRGKAFVAAELGCVPTASLSEAHLSPARPITARDVGNFVYSWLQARIAFRRLSLEQRVARIRLLRNRCPESGSCDAGRAGELFDVFRRVRPFFYTAKQACLFDCYVLLLFYSRYELIPLWVFGIRTRPFGAHCWLQLDKYAVTGGHEFLRGFTPIMTV
ncbi:MAG TPA: lasso peptide biosynthesis B2 protein [Steroidobacteraceae bacterium]|nr:lasso peptide biosynthesis B2 protein [Steroidobacteraceae bacterium]